MSSSITEVGSTVSTSNAATGNVNSTSMGKDTFMKLLVAQVTHQDPMKPMDDTAMVAQLAQFSALEQAETSNKTLELIAQQQMGLANSAIAGLVGKNVTIKGSTVSISDTNKASQCNFGLGASASSVKVSIVDSNGKTVRTIDAGARPEGAVSVAWDGKDDSGIVQKAGAYSVVVEAKNADGNPIEVTQETTGMLMSVSFENGYANLHLDNGANAPAANLIQVNAPSGK